MSDPQLEDAASELRFLVGRLMRRLRAVSEDAPITFSQASVLSLVDRHGPATTAALAKAERMRPQSMGATIMALEEAGLVERTADPSDGRQSLIQLSDKGRHHLKEVRRTREGWLVEALEDRLDPHERAVVIQALHLLRRLVEE
ncbi:MarR family winged helix-turn-helix transcriptional regulator [Streptantibioticus cattleyicolor]|uniref:Transcriptional regulator, MarR family n=1 Tax=Streptantibioticus cattleyicolor (strain ATCC 35852 / DSM 46488 / JCM 4925 / NBRC 14057 / NRRL 8057) TaxID=1003195 RepID=F8JJZ0_STREN|nr:MarR family transcriptional regulator [Streptantibioticus cattleyicolor]AEW98576.1 transcriptional regulator, MarR family [Streptantibioticus cattleyicolor NRRL 8057 = DSM 46488]CCB72365.1 conserved protein of unknown function [Streptantibioticus cattleyicolor NRRL 8057 = DSM 46488]